MYRPHPVESTTRKNTGHSALGGGNAIDRVRSKSMSLIVIFEESFLTLRPRSPPSSLHLRVYFHSGSPKSQSMPRPSRYSASMAGLRFANRSLLPPWIEKQLRRRNKKRARARRSH